jgi:multidrug efflux system outer membrane protein
VIFNALRETNDALVGTVKKREEAAAQAKRVAALREYARLSRIKFDNGYASYLEVLYAENELFGAELSAVRSQADGYGQLVAVYKAMGGGWLDTAAALAPVPQSAADRAEKQAR